MTNEATRIPSSRRKRQAMPQAPPVEKSGSPTRASTVTTQMKATEQRRTCEKQKTAREQLLQVSPQVRQEKTINQRGKPPAEVKLALLI